jgi:hypothetical protein
MQTTETSVAGNDLLVLTRESPSRTQKLLAFVVVPGILAVVFIISRPLAGVQLRTIDAFVPFYVTAILLNNLITSVLLFAQFSILRTRALLVIANGYLFAGLMIIPYTLSFPGVFEPGQSLIGGLQSTPWLYILRHCGFAMFVVAFALLRDFDVSTPYRHSVRQSIFPSFAATVAVVLAAAFVCIAGDTLLPTIINDRSHFDATWIYYAGGPIASLYVLAVILLWFRRHTVLGLWLMVVSCVHLAGVPAFDGGVGALEKRFAVAYRLDWAARDLRVLGCLGVMVLPWRRNRRGSLAALPAISQRAMRYVVRDLAI